jgi:hypothetical protein
MRAQQDLQVSLRERYRRLLVAGYRSFPNEAAMTRNWIQAQPPLAAILAEAASVEPDLDVEGWRQGLSARTRWVWPSATEAGRATLAWSVLDDIADNPLKAEGYSLSMASSSNFNDKIRGLVERVLTHVFDYLGDNVAASSSVLFTLGRFVRHVEWFTRDELYAQ